MNYASMVKSLSSGETLQCRPSGNSMTPRIKSKQKITISPDVTNINRGDVVFCRVNGSFYFHLVKAIGRDGRYLIGNNHGRDNGWTRTIYGKIVAVED